MSGEEGRPEDRKLSAVKSWFTRSVSFGGVHGSSTAMAAAAASQGVSEGNGHHGEDQEAWGGFNITLKQLSMRRSKAGNENYERETALGSPSMTPRNVTPLVPLTPLRWKSSPGSEPESEQQKAVSVERSRLGLSVSNGSRDNLHTQGSELEHKEEQDDHVHATPFEGFYSKPQTTAEEEGPKEEGDELSSAIESPSGLEDMKTSPGEDVMTMTIDSLRARVLAERSASKAAKERIQELSRKVLELELKLEQVIEEKNKAEKSAEEALLKLLTGDFAQVADCTAKALHIPSAESGSGGEEIKEELRRAESSVGDFSRTVSIASSLESKDSEDSRRKSQGRNEIIDASAVHADLWLTPKNMFGSGGESPKKQEKRAAIENRLWSMWSQINADMSALVGDGSQEALAQEQLMNWMDQVPAALQNRIPQKSTKDMISQDAQLFLSPPEGVQDKVHVCARSDAEIMLEEYEAHKRVQREWERNYYESKQRLEQSRNQPDYLNMDYYKDRVPKESVDNFAMPQHGAHQRKSSIDFRHHPHLLNGDAPKTDFESWGGGQHGRNTVMDGRYNYNGNPECPAALPSFGNCDVRQSYEEDLRSRHETRHQHDTYLDAKTNGPPLQHMPPQANQNGSAKAATDPKLYLGYGPAYDVPRVHAPMQPLQQDRVSNKSITNVLLALQKAKASIQKSGAEHVPYTGITNQPRAGSKPVKSEYGLDPQAHYTRTVEHDLGATRIRPSNSSLSQNYNPSAMGLRSAANGHHSYVDQLNVGKGIDFFF